MHRKNAQKRPPVFAAPAAFQVEHTYLHASFARSYLRLLSEDSNLEPCG
jgi:hypothetical protein